MTTPAEPRQKAGLSDYLAAERNLLVWIRTGLALMGFGFVVARFGLSGAILRIVFVVWNGAYRSGNNRKCFCRLAPYPVSSTVGLRRNDTLSCFGPGRRDCFFSGISRSGDGDLSHFRSRPYSFAVKKGGI
jgi:hypothetical protein